MMSTFEVSCSALRHTLENRSEILQGLRRASGAVDRAACSLDQAGSSFSEVSGILCETSLTLQELEGSTDSFFSALQTVCEICSGAEESIAAYEPEAFNRAPGTEAGGLPRSPVIFTTSDAAGKSAYLSSAALALLSQFPGLAMSIGSRIEFPVAGGMTVYGSASVAGSYTRSDHVKISHALDTNTGLLKENITVSNDGKTISFTKDGISMSVRTDTGTWKVDPTTLSRTTGAQIDEHTYCSFTEKVNADGMSSMEESVTTKAGSATVSTTVGIKPSEPEKPKPGPSPVPVPGLDTSLGWRQRMEKYEKLLISGLAGEFVPVPSAAVQPVFPQ